MTVGVYPPGSNPPLVSSSALPCPCMKPSGETFALAKIFLIFGFLVGFCFKDA